MLKSCISKYSKLHHSIVNNDNSVNKNSANINELLYNNFNDYIWIHMDSLIQM